MTLTSRVSGFFLVWIALSLVGLATAVYLIARADLYREADSRIEGTLDALSAAADVEPEGIEWEAHERTLPRGDGPNAVAWVVSAHDTSGDLATVIDRSSPRAEEWLWAGGKRVVFDPSTGDAWRISRRQLRAGPAPDGRPPDVRALSTEPKRLVKYRTIEMVAGVPLRPIQDELHRLAIWLAVPSLGVWVSAAVVGRWYCRRMLAPVGAMAASARRLSANDPRERLVVLSQTDELRDLGQAFNGALDRLEEAFERQRRFTGDAAHQLRTPLAAMLGQVEVALRRDRDGPEYRATLARVAGEIRHLNRLTESLLFLARADAEAALPGLVDIDMVQWTNDHMAKWQHEHAEARTTVVVEGASIARGHPELLGQLLANLLDNAVKYSPPGSLITVRILAREGEVELAVEDSGSGIAAEDLPHVFAPFFRAATAREAAVGGVGLGLAIARRIAQAMGGRLTAESHVGRGSRFAVILPAAMRDPVLPPGSTA